MNEVLYKLFRLGRPCTRRHLISVETFILADHRLLGFLACSDKGFKSCNFRAESCSSRRLASLKWYFIFAMTRYTYEKILQSVILFLLPFLMLITHQRTTAIAWRNYLYLPSIYTYISRHYSIFLRLHETLDCIP